MELINFYYNINKKQIENVGKYLKMLIIATLKLAKWQHQLQKLIRKCKSQLSKEEIDSSA